MSEVPHCPNCGRADKVDVVPGAGYSYVCRNVFCSKERILLEDIEDYPFMDMCPSMFMDHQIEDASMEYSDDCECGWCE